MFKRKSSSAAIHEPAITTMFISVPWDESVTRPAKRRKSQRQTSQTKSTPLFTNPDVNANVLDGPEALRASSDADEPDERMNAEKAGMNVEKQIKENDDEVPSLMTGGDSDSALSELSDMESPVKAASTKAKARTRQSNLRGRQDIVMITGKVATSKKEIIKKSQFFDPEADDEEGAKEEEIQTVLSRPSPVNSDYLPLP